jgi:acyl-CoA thioesterase I
MVAWSHPRLTSTLTLACLFLSACTESSGSETTRALQLEAPTRTAEPTLPIVMPEREGLPKVAFLGDNIAAGQYVSEQQAFPHVVQRRLNTSFKLINASVSGDTTEAGLRRIDWLLKQHHPKIVVIELGENDKEQALPVAEVEANLRAIISKLRAAEVKPLLLGLSVVPNANMERARAVAYARELEAIYPRIASELDVAFVPHFMQGVADRKELTLPDGVQPTPEGHERVASNILEALRRLLAE